MSEIVRYLPDQERKTKFRLPLKLSLPKCPLLSLSLVTPNRWELKFIKISSKFAYNLSHVENFMKCYIYTNSPWWCWTSFDMVNKLRTETIDDETEIKPQKLKKIVGVRYSVRGAIFMGTYTRLHKICHCAYRFRFGR